MNCVGIETKIVNPLMGDKIPLPSAATKGAAAIDLRACLENELILEPGETKLIGSGIAVNIKDPGIVGIIAPRSGLGIKKGIVLANTIGIIDSDYQGEIGIGLFNRSDTPYRIKPGERICQIMFMPVFTAKMEIVDRFTNASARGTGGFGHTGRE